MQQLIPTKSQILEVLPKTAAKYGVVFGVDGEYDHDLQMVIVGNAMPKTLDVAVLQILQYEAKFSEFNASGHLIDLATCQEIGFDRRAPYAFITHVVWSTLKPSEN